jgi:hypothetical protein
MRWAERNHSCEEKRLKKRGKNFELNTERKEKSSNFDRKTFQREEV